MSVSNLKIFILLYSFISALAVASDIDQDQVLKLRKEGVILPLETILEKAKTIQAGNILEVELEQKKGKFIYEIEFLDENGSVWELKFDAKSAALISKEEEDGH